MKYKKSIIFLSIFISLVVFFYIEIAPEIKRVNENNAKIDESNKKLHDEMNRSFKNYESVYNEDTKTRYWTEVP